MQPPLGFSFAAAATAGLALAAFLAPRIEAELTRDADAAIANTVGARTLSTRFHGRRAEIIGEAIDPQALEAAADATLHSNGRGGLLRGGVASVDVSKVRVILAPQAPNDTPTPEEPVRTASLNEPPEKEEPVRQEPPDARGPSPTDSNVAVDVEKALAFEERVNLEAVEAAVVETAPLDGQTPSSDQEQEPEQEPSPQPDAEQSENAARAAACQARLSAVATPNEVSFARNSERPRPESIPYIEAAAGVLKTCGAVRITVGGHTDATGTEEVNRRLSRRRAQNVRDILVGFGVSRRRIESVGYGSGRPVTNEEGDAQERNRRITVDVTAIDAGPTQDGGAQ
ncbi:MAG: OmpA family protein [Pseudomonadota bacterium]